MRKVLYLSHATREVYAIIREAVPPGFELLTLERDSDEERRQKLADTPIVIVAATPFRKPLIEAAAKLELVHHQGVGWQDTTDHALLKSRGIPLAFTPEGTTIGVAEHTVLLILAALKRLPFADSELRQGRFHINALRPVSRAHRPHRRLPGHGQDRAGGRRAPRAVWRAWDFLRPAGHFSSWPRAARAARRDRR